MKAFTYTLITVLLLSIFTSCTGEPAAADDKPVSRVDETLKNTRLPEDLGRKLQSMGKNPNDHKKNSLYVNQIANFYIKAGDTDKAVNILKRGLIFHSSGQNTPTNRLTLMEALKADPKKKQDYINFLQSINTGFPDMKGLEKFKSDLPSSEPPMKDKIAKIQSNLTDTSTGRLDLIKVNEFVNIVEFFVMGNPQSDDSPAYLKLAAEVVNSIKVYPRAIMFYDWILTNFPNSKEAPQALFMKGFTLDDGIGNKKAAKPVYEEFLRKYPNNDFADDTKFLLQNINKSDEEIIKDFDTQKKE